MLHNPDTRRVPRPLPTRLSQNRPSHLQPSVSHTTTYFSFSLPSPSQKMARFTIAKKSSTTSKLLRRIGAKPLKTVPAKRDPLRKAIRKFVERRMVEETILMLEKKVLYMQRLLAKTDRMFRRINRQIEERQMFEKLENMAIWSSFLLPFYDYCYL